MRRIFQSLILILLITPGIVRGEEGGGFERLDQVRRQMEDTQKDLVLVQSDYNKQQGEVKKIAASVKTLTDKETALKKELGKVESSQKESQRALSEIEGRISEIESLSMKRVRALYMLEGGRAGFLEVRDTHNFDQASVYVSKVRKFDQNLIDSLKDLKLRHHTETGKLTKLRKDQSDLLAKLGDQRRDLTFKFDSQKEALTELGQKKKALDTLLLSLKAQALRLETVLKSLTGGEDETKPQADVQAKSAKMLGFDGDGLPSKSFLVAPLTKAKVIHRFGRYKAEVTGDGFRKGVELGGSIGQVSAIDDGRVAYVGKMPQIGTVIIIDHGKREYSLYGRLAETSVRVGEVVNSGSPVGQTGTPDQEGRTLYFEVRKGGNPTDPEDLFGKKLTGR